jgi:hypothetical protein
MYCVVRFDNFQSDVALQSVGDAVDACLPGLFEGPDSRFPSRFSCSLANGHDWDSQRQGMLDFMRGCGEVIRNAQTSGVNVVFDLAIYQEDYEERYVTGFLIDVELINQLHEYQVGFVISVYSAGEQRGRTTTISQ